jgi:aminoglycoside phosphotransferase (APT) family kinase protein
MNKSELSRVLQHILGKPAQITAVRHHQHPGTGVIDIITTSDGVYVLKTYTQERVESRGSAARLAQIEIRNMELIRSATSFAKPHYYGSYQNSYLQDFVSGTLLVRRLGEVAPAERERYQNQSIDTLVAVHTAVGEVSDRRRMRRNFTAASLERMLGKAIARIVEIGIPAYRDKGNTVPKEWVRTLADFPIGRMVSDLAVTDEYVLGHGDFKGDNLIVGDDGRLWVIDWLGMSKARPWYDLAYLLVDVPLAHKWPFVGRYVELMQQRGYLKGQNQAMTKQLFTSGMIYQELVRARSNALFVRERPDSHHAQQLHAALTSLSGLVGA